MILPVTFILALVLFFVYLSFQITTINGAWREFSRSYRLRNELEWKRWPKQTIFMLPTGGPFRALRTAMLRKNVTVGTSEVGLGLFVSPFVRLGTSTPVCIPWHDMETGERVAFRRTVTEYRVAKLSGYTICLPSNIAKEVERSEDAPLRLLVCHRQRATKGGLHE
jgi:hypothetical protein